MYFATKLMMLIFGASTFATSIPELDTRGPLDPGLPKCGVEIFIGGFVGQQARPNSKGFLKDFPGEVYSYSEPGGHVGRKEITMDFCKKDCDRSFGPTPKSDLIGYWKDDSNVGDFVYWVEKVDGKECNENGFGKNCAPYIETPRFKASMTDNAACTEGDRNPAFGVQGYWWRCQLECKEKK